MDMVLLDCSKVRARSIISSIIAGIRERRIIGLKEDRSLYIRVFRAAPQVAQISL